MLQNEFGITDVADPLGGSWFVEQLTSQLEAEALRLIDAVDQMGGAVAAVETGFYQQTIADEAYAKELRIASGEDVVVGVNAFLEDEPDRTPEHFDVPAGLAEDQVARLHRVRSQRDQAAVSAALQALESAASSEANLMPAIVAAVRARATLGEVSSALRSVFGEYRPASAVQI